MKPLHTTSQWKQICTLIDQRVEIFRTMAPALTRVGASNPNRQKINATRAQVRRDARRALRRNSADIAMLCAQLVNSKHAAKLLTLKEHEPDV